MPNFFYLVGKNKRLGICPG